LAWWLATWSPHEGFGGVLVVAVLALIFLSSGLDHVTPDGGLAVRDAEPDYASDFHEGQYPAAHPVAGGAQPYAEVRGDFPLAAPFYADY